MANVGQWKATAKGGCVTGQPVARYLASGRIAQQHAAPQATCTSGRLCQAVEADVGVLTAAISCSGTGEELCTYLELANH
jgi:hypothetical protein